jgi:hypothetical protein
MICLLDRTVDNPIAEDPNARSTRRLQTLSSSVECFVHRHHKFDPGESQRLGTEEH